MPGPSLVASEGYFALLHRLLIAVASPVAEHRFRVHGFM